MTYMKNSSVQLVVSKHLLVVSLVPEPLEELFFLWLHEVSDLGTDRSVFRRPVTSPGVELQTCGPLSPGLWRWMK